MPIQDITPPPAPDLKALRKKAGETMVAPGRPDVQSTQDARDIWALLDHIALLSDQLNKETSRAELAEKALEKAAGDNYLAGYEDGDEQPGDRQ